MRFHRSIAWMLCAAVVITTTAMARPMPGERIKVHRSGDTVEGQVTTWADDEVRMIVEGDAISVPFSSITSVERLHGTRGHAFLGVILGGAAGAGVALAVDSGEDDADDETFGTGGTIALGAGSAVVGGLLGHLIRTDRWTQVDPGSWSMAIAPTGDGLTASVGWRF